MDPEPDQCLWQRWIRLVFVVLFCVVHKTHCGGVSKGKLLMISRYILDASDTDLMIWFQLDITRATASKHC
jgi:hypothetical protein